MSDNNAVTRAELVRRRREQENARRIAQATREATRPLPPAKQTSARATAKPVQKAAKRGYNISLALPNTNYRAFHLPRPRLGWRMFSFFLVLLLGSAVYFAFNRPELRAGEAQVTGNRILTGQEVNAVLNNAGQPIFMLIPSELETRVRLNFPEVVSVRVSVALPNLVSVHILERNPVVRWEQSGGYTWVAEDGVAFRPRGEMEGLISVVADSAPPVEGGVTDPLTPTPFISVEMIRTLQGLASHVPPGQPILYNSGFGFGWNDPRGWRVYFGVTASDVELKMRVYEAMVASLTQRGIRPALINVTFPSAPYYRMSQ